MKMSELHFRVVDHGLFLPVALRLARDAARVSYWTPCERDFPTCHDDIGDGFPNLQRVDSIWENRDEVDCFVFPDIGFVEEQLLAKEMGYPVWGTMGGCELEVKRGLFLKTLEDIGLPVPEHSVVRGIANLKAYLKDKEDRYIKVSGIRGDWETFHWRSWKEDENELDAKSVRLGPFRELVDFYVFTPIDADIEDGCDSWCVAGQFPELVIHGVEAKDKAFVGTFQRFDDLPEELRKVSEAIGPVLADYGYQGCFSTEVRITDSGESYFIDPTCRFGSPPSQVMCEMLGNFTEVIWGGANGELVEAEPAAKFGVQALTSMKGSHRNWGYLKVDDELGRWLKCGKCMFCEDLLCFPPDHESTSSDVGWLTGIGDSMEEAIKHLKHNIELLPDGASCDATQLCELLEEIQKAEEKGMEFTDQPVPGPESVIES